MSKSGGKILTVQALKARGSYNPTKHSTRRTHDEAAAESLQIEPPEWLSEQQRKIWAMLIDDIANQISLEMVDATALGALILSLTRWIENAQELDNEGPIIIDRNGAYKPNPRVRIDKAYFDQCLALFRQFGLTPYSRQSIEAISTSAGDGDEWAI